MSSAKSLFLLVLGVGVTFWILSSFFGREPDVPLEVSDDSDTPRVTPVPSPQKALVAAPIAAVEDAEPHPKEIKENTPDAPMTAAPVAPGAPEVFRADNQAQATAETQETAEATLPDDRGGKVARQYVGWGVLTGERNFNGCKKGEPGWFIYGENVSDYKFVLPSASEDANATAMIESVHDKPRPESGILAHCADGPFKPGERIRVRASVKSNGVQDWATLFLRAKNRFGETLKYERTVIREHPGWRVKAVEMEVPEGTTAVTYGVLLETVGKVWIKKVSVTRVPGP